MRRLTVLAVAALFLIGQGADANHHQGVHWAESQRAPLRLYDSVKARWQPALTSAADRWDTDLPSVSTQVIQSKESRRFRKKCKPVVGAVRVCSYPYGAGKGWAGLAEYTYNPVTQHIVSSRIRLNDSTTRGAPGDVLTTVACHEIGHILGLRHYEVSNHSHLEATSCMRTPATPGGVSVPGALDISEIEAAHNGHIDPMAVSVMSSEDAEVIYRKDGLVTVRWALPAPK